MKPKVVNLYAGPGTGKSTTMAGLFAELKHRGVNTEMAHEWVKEAAWEGRRVSQELIFGQQSWRLDRLAGKVSVIISDSPVLLTAVYSDSQALKAAAREVYERYENLDFFLVRSEYRPYNPMGRYETEEEARKKDEEILDMLGKNAPDFTILPFDRNAPHKIADILHWKGWTL